MKVSAKFLNALVCLGALALGSAAFAQPKDEKKPAGDKPAAKPADPKPAVEKPAVKPGDKPAAGNEKKSALHSGDDMAKIMEMMQKAAAPGEFHAKLKPLAGKWTFTTKARMTPEQPWEVTTGKAEYKWILGGRILLQEVKANPGPSDAMMGGPYEGFGMTGYDNVAKKYYNIWSDIMGTGIMTSTGTCDGSGKTFTYMSEAYDCPMTGEKKTTKSVLKIAGDDNVVFEMYDKGADGKEFQNIEVSYARQK